MPLEKEKPGKKLRQINFCSVMAFREIGRRNESMNMFTTIMNMPPPMSRVTYNEINTSLHEAYTKAADQSMRNVAKEVRNITTKFAIDNDIIDCHIGIDGSWQKRGYSSLNGVITAVARDNKKVIDFQVLSKFCRGYATWDKHEGTDYYAKWKAKHAKTCQINHTKSSGAMESTGAVEIFS